MSFIAFDVAPWHAGTVAITSQRGRFRPQNLEMYSRQSLPTDPIGTTTVTLTNVVVGSAIRIEESDGTLREARTATGTTEAFTLSVYSSGSAKNDLVIKVRKATSAPKYQPFSTQASLSLTPQSIFIAQVADVIAA